MRRASSKRLTYCFDRLRMRTLGSLPAVPETPVVRNARQLFLSDDRRSPICPLNRRRRAPVLTVRTRILGAQGSLARRTRGQSRQQKLEPEVGRFSASEFPERRQRARKLRLRSGQPSAPSDRRVSETASQYCTRRGRPDEGGDFWTALPSSRFGRPGRVGGQKFASRAKRWASDRRGRAGGPSV